MRYYIADCHFYHAALNDKMDKRGFDSVVAMNEYMIEKWNSKVRPNDTVVVLGDLSLGTPEENEILFKRLHGKIWLILGNHDRYLSSPKYRTNRFEWIRPYEQLHDNHRRVICCHYPIM
jgi:calcineurin-like phosphoesterase family protein